MENTSSQKEKKEIKAPLNDILVNFVKNEQPEYSDFIVSTIHHVIKNSENQEEDLTNSLNPILCEKTKTFVEKLFIKNEIAAPKKPKKVTFVEEPEIVNEGKKKELNREVVFNKVNEMEHSGEDIVNYAKKYGNVESVRKLNKGKFLVIFDCHESAKSLVECFELVLGDSSIKKFFNVYTPDLCMKPTTNPIKKQDSRKFDLVSLLQDQKNIIDRMETHKDISQISHLRIITLRIRNYILQKEEKQLPSHNFQQKNTKPLSGKTMQNTEDSLYSNLFN
ncbi:hypothetical protein NUSPORA_01720 [Nucleospora cyclopteri]